MPKPTWNDAAHWRRRAEETRSIAAQLDDPAAKKAMLEVAEEYEKLAVLAPARRVGGVP